MQAKCVCHFAQVLATQTDGRTVSQSDNFISTKQGNKSSTSSTLLEVAMGAVHCALLSLCVWAGERGRGLLSVSYLQLD